MSDDALKALRKNASSKKRIATEWASKIHDVVEDSLWTEYQSLPDLAQQAVDACKAWEAAQKTYDQAVAEAQ
ncbi:MAG: hypothetical protein JKY26_01200 [Pseudomonas sp.]|uniref:CCE_0567 family metalloprotein n=1 Tax=Thalassolituus oleivorans TaxID=187493 RepID=UPI001A490D97|nr:CCE_0567 family metalloprotein [Thalassolituus oleivorans]MBL4832562.1 hypothetical protein [Pseudomonas sp.]|tara:strand:- start:34568 stop:34783 length:216 start_codon:yes stop_codon:yes gene_type:complete